MICKQVLMKIYMNIPLKITATKNTELIKLPVPNDVFFMSCSNRTK